MITQFNPENKNSLSFGETLGTAMNITDIEDAKQYVDAYADWLTSKASGKPQINAHTCAINNIIYYSGYYGTDIQKRVNNLFGNI